MRGVIYITQDFDLALKEIRGKNQKITIIGDREREFLVKDADSALSRAYITSPQLELIVLISPKFSTIAQNKLLKILEEPPKNKEFILITKTKSALLPTIKSRLPIKDIYKRRLETSLNIDLETLNTETIYKFLKENKRISKIEAKETIEYISISLLKSNRYKLDISLLNFIQNSIKALELNSYPSFIISGLFLKLLEHKID